MLIAVLVSFGIIFLAELPDKSQLMTMTYALRYRWWEVLGGAAAAAFIVQGLSVTIGHFAGLAMPHRPIAFVAAIIFLTFAVMTWRESRNSSSAVAPASRSPSAVLSIISSYVLAEFGDMSMLASVTLAANHNWIGVWAGGTAAMIAANSLAIAIGVMLHRQLPTRLLRTATSALFLVFGLWLLFDSALGWHGVAVIVTTGMACSAAAVTARAALRLRPHAIQGEDRNN